MFSQASVILSTGVRGTRPRQTPWMQPPPPPARCSVKTLPCPKLRLRVVNMQLLQVCIPVGCVPPALDHYLRGGVGR